MICCCSADLTYGSLIAVAAYLVHKLKDLQDGLGLRDELKELVIVAAITYGIFLLLHLVPYNFQKIEDLGSVLSIALQCSDLFYV